MKHLQRILKSNMKIIKAWNESNTDIKLLWLSVFVRLISYGLSNQVLTLFLHEIEVSEAMMGWFMSLTLVGDVVISYFLTWYADSWGRRRILIYGSVMMIISGFVFSYSENFHILLLFAIVGVISPSSDEIGPFKSIEESMIAHLTPHNRRPEVYSIHSLMGMVGSALGSIICGVLLFLFKKTGFITSNLYCYKAIFRIYALLALVKLVLMLLLSKKTELDGHHEDDDQNEETPLIIVDTIKSNKLSKESLSVLLKLLVIFMIDSLGYGFMDGAWMVYYYSKVFMLSSLALGILFFFTKLFMASSVIPSAMIARKFGPVKATLLVQIPSGIFCILIPFAYKHLSISVMLLNIFYFTLAMDVTPRQILLTNIIKPKDLTKVMGVVNIGKTFARCIGPIFTGLLANRGFLWLCYIISGSLVILADINLAVMFYGIDDQIMAKTNS